MNYPTSGNNFFYQVNKLRIHQPPRKYKIYDILEKKILTLNRLFLIFIFLDTFIQFPTFSFQNKKGSGLDN